MRRFLALFAVVCAALMGPPLTLEHVLGWTEIKTEGFTLLWLLVLGLVALVIVAVRDALRGA